MGKWIKQPREEQHRCVMPSTKNEDVRIRDQWECDCGVVWEIYSFTSLWDGGRTANWRRYNESNTYPRPRNPLEPAHRLPGESEQSHMEIR